MRFWRILIPVLWVILLFGCPDGEEDDDSSQTTATPPCQGECTPDTFTPGATPQTPVPETPLPETPTPLYTPTPFPVTPTPEASTPTPPAETPTLEPPSPTPFPSTPSPAPDWDMDGYSTADGDCNDDDPSVHPGAAEVCNETDENCDGEVDEGLELIVSYADLDEDSFGSTTECTVSCAVPFGCVVDATDCDDTDPEINPSVAELCNGIDDDCDDEADEGVLLTWYADGDADGYGLEDSIEQPSLQACTQPDSYALSASDCDDTNPEVHPNAEEVPYDGLDNDCQDGDEVDVDGDGYVSDQVAGDPYTGPFDCDDENATVFPGATEVGDGLDNDCDGVPDDGLDTNDDDGDCVCEAAADACTGSSNEACSSLYGGDCQDGDSSIYPGAAELCNGTDDDCSGVIDEGVKTRYYRDVDKDGYGETEKSQEACEAPDGYVPASSDCDDADPAVHPGAQEICDGVDSNCDGIVDDDLKAPYCRDVDGDGFGVDGSVIESCYAVAGYAVLCGDCDDTRPSVNPDAKDVCNGRDDDCDGLADEGLTTTWYRDRDGDGHGTSESLDFCTDPGAGWSLETGDCDDAAPSVFPGHVELCDGKDNDCDNQVDEDVTTYTFYRDADGDGYGTESDTKKDCAQPEGYSLEDHDCNDGNPDIHPGAEEVCDSVDNDCSGTVDESCWDEASWDEGMWGP